MLWFLGKQSNAIMQRAKSQSVFPHDACCSCDRARRNGAVSRAAQALKGEVSAAVENGHAFGLNQSLDGHVDHQQFAPGPALFSSLDRASVSIHEK